MNNVHSDAGEREAYDRVIFIKHIPLVGAAYGMGRAAVYAAKGNFTEAMNSTHDFIRGLAETGRMIGGPFAVAFAVPRRIMEANNTEERRD